MNDPKHVIKDSIAYAELPAVPCLSSIKTLQSIQRQLQPRKIADFSKEIYLIYPIVVEGKQLHSLVFYETHAVLTWEVPKDLVVNWIQEVEHLAYDQYCRTMKQLLEGQYHKIPCASRSSCLFPTESPKNVETTLWMNPRRIVQLTPMKDVYFSTQVTMDNGVQLTTKMTAAALKQQMTRGFQCHGIIKQEYMYATSNTVPSSLVMLLGLGNNQLASELCSQLEQDFVLPPRGAFQKNYNQQLIQRTINEWYN